MRYIPGEHVGVLFQDVNLTAKGMVISETDTWSGEYLVWVETQRLGEHTITGNMLKVKKDFLQPWDQPRPEHEGRPMLYGPEEEPKTSFKKEHGHQERTKG